ncbi:Eco29kI family restriction endonuclease [Demequina subtropica]|uniref:Eco29kI family restriction endonuclease n=1 Tax=Demequina subtropica TaxID=1638989 RepID=UPI001E5E294F|nr:Eco29kI family restriction endonuclease [Demequina subtropica]
MSNLAHSILTRMEEKAAQPLQSIQPFEGGGVYAIYYSGPFPAYAPLAAANVPTPTVPIYVGKSGASGSRAGTGKTGASKTPSKFKLYQRLQKHLRSIEAATNLDAADFSARWLVVDEIWVPVGESAVIREHSPLWNSIIPGFGSNPQGSGRDLGERSRWDTLHPGRANAVVLKDRKETAQHIEQDALNHLNTHLP